MSDRWETHLSGMALELRPLRLPRGLGLGKLLLKLSQTTALIPEQPAQLLQCHLHVSQCLDILIGLQMGGQGLGQEVFEGHRGEPGPGTLAQSPAQDSTRPWASPTTSPGHLIHEISALSFLS